MSRLKNILLAFRPKTLTAALVPCLAATALAQAHSGTIKISLLYFALAASFLIQIGTNLVNDAVDFKKGADNENRIGPQRITQAGILSPTQVMLLGSFCFLLAIACGVPLVLQGGWPIVAIGLASVAMGYAYTAGPFPLAYLGLGDLFVILFFGLVAVMGMFFVLTGQWSGDALWMGLQIGFHATVLIAINNLRDAEGDRQVGKKTLAVRFGANFSRFEIFTLIFLPFSMNFYWFKVGHVWAAALPLLALPLGFVVAKNVFTTAPGPIYNKFLGQSAGLHLLFGLLLAAGLVLS